MAAAASSRWSRRSSRPRRRVTPPLWSAGGELHHLGEPEAVAGRIAEAGIDAVGPLLGRLDELDAAALELLVAGLAVVGGEEHRAGEALGHEVADLGRRLLVH